MKVRNPKKYYIKKANTERYKDSSIPYMQRLLNEDIKKRKKDMDDLDIELSKAKKRKKDMDDLVFELSKSKKRKCK